MKTEADETLNGKTSLKSLKQVAVKRKLGEPRVIPRKNDGKALEKLQNIYINGLRASIPTNQENLTSTIRSVSKSVLIPFSDDKSLQSHCYRFKLLTDQQLKYVNSYS